MNIIIGVLVLWFASKIFPNIIQVSDPITLIMAVILIGITTIVVGCLATLFGFLGIIALDINSIFISLIAYMFANLIAVYLICDYLPGFNIVGFWPKLLVSLAFVNYYDSATSSRS